jgi:NDP-sugar pyrophosphorylase family protein
MKAVILAGGRGRRLAPYTTILPKPLMPVGDIAILEVVIRQLKHAGVGEITMAGSRFGLRIRYSRENKPLGTAGPLSLIEGLDEPFLLMNGDLLTTLDYRAMWEHHCSGEAIGTLATFQRSAEIDLGVIETNVQGHVTKYVEKPTYHYTVSTGIYVFDPLVLSFVPEGKRLDLPELVSKLLTAGHRIATYPFEGYWLDIGRHEDYERAIEEFEHHRAEFLPAD